MTNLNKAIGENSLFEQFVVQTGPIRGAKGSLCTQVFQLRLKYALPPRHKWIKKPMYLRTGNLSLNRI